MLTKNTRVCAGGFGRSQDGRNHAHRTVYLRVPGISGGKREGPCHSGKIRAGGGTAATGSVRRPGDQGGCSGIPGAPAAAVQGSDGQQQALCCERVSAVLRSGALRGEVAEGSAAGVSGGAAGPDGVGVPPAALHCQGAQEPAAVPRDANDLRHRYPGERCASSRRRPCVLAGRRSG